jgi:epsilon-lactone hydrolase
MPPQLENLVSAQQLEPLIAMIRARSRNAPGDLAQARREFEALAANLPPATGVSRTDAAAGAIRTAWLSGPEASNRSILYLHGGAYVLGSIETHAALAGRLALAAKARCLVPDYRLAPEHPHPAAVNDAADTYRWLLDQGADPAKTAIAGDSAGGGLTLATLVKLRDEGVPLPAAAVCISPWVDLEATGDSIETKAAEDPMVQRDGILAFSRLFIGGGDPRDPLAAPLYADLHGLPPVLIQVGSAEILLDDAARISRRLEDSGVPVDLQVWDDMIHVWHFFAGVLDEGQAAIDQIGRFLSRHLRK